MDTRPRRLAILTSFSGEGGVERMIANLTGALCRTPGLELELILARATGRQLERLAPGLAVRRLRSASASLATPELIRHLRRRPPDVLLAVKDRPGRLALRARRRGGGSFPVFVQLHTTMSAAEARKPAPLRWWRYRQIRRWYPRADGLLAVSGGVAEDVAALSGVPRRAIAVIPNPVITPELFALAGAPLDHPWLARDRRRPVFLGAGRFTEQKDFSTLLAAFARLRRTTPARLILIGNGPLRGRLEQEAERLGITRDVTLPGFQANPYAWMARADAFVLSSAWEGSPTVLTEALALGRQVVATDCPSGPREILAGGAVAPLVPVGDPGALAAAMAEVLARPREPASLRAAADPYTAEASAGRLLQVLGLEATAAGSGRTGQAVPGT